MENLPEKQKKKFLKRSFVLRVKELLHLILVATFSKADIRHGNALCAYPNKHQPALSGCCNHRCREGRDCPLR